MSDTHNTEPLAYAYDDTDGELIAKLYTREVIAECNDSWWIRVEMAEGVALDVHR